MATRAHDPLVSVIIPCFNAERWLRDTVCSALDQDGVAVEVIVVDDGSTDDSIDTIADLDDRVRIEQTSHRGGNHARNRALSMATGDHIQYLDADDVLLPGKFTAQVNHLAETGADVSYCDWRILFETSDGSPALGPIRTPSEPPNMLCALLGGWWFALASPLLTRLAAERIGPWDESLPVAQDAEYWARAAHMDLTFAYLPGCFAMYRSREGSVSGSDPHRWARHHVAVVEQVAKNLSAEGRFDSDHRRAVAQRLLFLGRTLYAFDRQQWRVLVDRAAALHPDHAARQSRQYRAINRVVGARGAELAASAKRSARSRLGHVAPLRDLLAEGDGDPTPTEWTD